MTCLDISYPQLWSRDCSRIPVVLAQCEACLYVRDILEPDKLPMLRDLPQPLHAGGLVGRVGIEFGYAQHHGA